MENKKTEISSNNDEAWPSLSYEAFKETQYILHRALQMLGKLKLFTPFEPHWANVILWPISQGLTTGAIPYDAGSFTITCDLIHHKLIFNNSFGKQSEFELKSCSISSLYQNFQDHLHKIEVDYKLNPLPQEIPNAISFEIDHETRIYDPLLANTWFRIMLSVYQVLMQFHARFSGISPPVGFMWGTFDLRDARYSHKMVPPSKPGFIERNAMDVEQIESGFWVGNDIYPNPAFFSFTYPQPIGIEKTKIKPNAATWNNDLYEFILDYEFVRNAKNPTATILEFFESAYQAGADLAGWDSSLINTGKPK